MRITDRPQLGPRDEQHPDHWALNTTIRCQHRCVYCFEGSRAGNADVSPEETKALIDRAAEVVPEVIFMGAEPTLNPHLPDLIRHARKKGLRANISTNALRLADLEFLRRLLDAPEGRTRDTRLRSAGELADLPRRRHPHR